MEQQWISVKDVFPKFEVDVLLFDDWITTDKKERRQDVRVGYLVEITTRKTNEGIVQTGEWRGTEFAFNITHWMPLPLPPKE